MEHTASTSSTRHSDQGLLVRFGHDVVWLVIAVLFCLVELAVLLTEFAPMRLLRRNGAAAASRAADSRGPSEAAERAFAS